MEQLRACKVKVRASINFPLHFCEILVSSLKKLMLLSGLLNTNGIRLNFKRIQVAQMLGKFSIIERGYLSIPEVGTFWKWSLIRSYEKSHGRDQDQLKDLDTCSGQILIQKNDLNFAKDPDLWSVYIRDGDLLPSMHLLRTCDTEEENNYDPQSCVPDRSQLIMVNVQSCTVGTVWYSE